MIKIKSTNPKFSWILRKNPETQYAKNEPFTKSLRKGNVYGWFFDEQQFNMLFIDSPTESSFNTISDFEYLDRTRYCSPYLPIAMIGTLLASAQKEDVPEDAGNFYTELECLVEFADPKLAMRILNTATITVEHAHIKHHLYSLKFGTGRGVKFLLNYVIAFLITQAVADPNLYIPMDEASFNKYVEAMNNIDAPYYMRYITGMKCAKSPVVFGNNKDSLQNNRFKLNYGDSQNHRWMAIEKQLSGGGTLFDIGCGEMYYTRRLYSRYDSFFAFDADEKIQDRNKHLVELRNQEKIKLFGKFDSDSQLPSNSDTDVLLTEVLEHMPLETAKNLLDRVLSGNFNKVVVTVPNADFNCNYGLFDGLMRHPDHHYEPTESEFKKWMQVAAIISGNSVSFFDVGDGVLNNDGITYTHASLGAVFTKGN